MKKYFYLSFLIAGMSLTSCDDDDSNGVMQVNAILNFQAPQEILAHNPSFGIQSLQLKDINTGKVYPVIAPATRGAENAGLTVSVSVPEGIYRVDMEAQVSYVLDGSPVQLTMRATQESVSLTQSVTAPINLPCYLYSSSETGGFVLAEIFFTGSQTPEGKQYNGDKYFRIYNNSSDTLCADGLTIAESKFLTVQKYDYTPDIMDEAFSAQALYRIPLGGNRMVAPGESLLLCDMGKNHKEANPNSFDLTHADYEWYDESSNPNFTDNDTEVPNLEKIYCYTKTVWGPHNRGFVAYALARLGDDEAHQLSAEQYLQENYYTYNYEMVINGESYPMDGEAYKIPNKWILDAVNLSVESEYVWNVTSPALDRGWTYCGKMDQDKTRYGKSVRRKVLAGKILQDTNDSSADFLPEQTADPYFKFHE